MWLKVEGIPDHIGKEKLNELFSKMGVVDSVTIIKDIYSDRSRGFGFVEMSSQAEGEEAIRRLNGFILGGRQITVRAPSFQQLLQGEMEFREWLSENASEVLRRVGLKEEMIILDYGCGTGRFTIPSAKIVGRKGKVYAADVRSSALERVKEEAEKEGLGNIETVLCGSSDVITGLREESVDTILIYDVMHTIDDRKGLFKELHRVLRQDGFLSIFPMHMGTDKMLETVNEGKLFCLRERYGPPGHKSVSEILNFNKC